MRISTLAISALGALMLSVGGIGLTATDVAAADAATIAEGKKLAFDRKLGNCLACHVMGDGKLAGDIGPPLVAMKARFPDKAKLRAQVWDATKKNPNSMMPPFGRHQIISEDAIDKIVEYVYTL